MPTRTISGAKRPTFATRPSRWSTRPRSSSRNSAEAEGGSKVPEEALAKIDAAIVEAKTALGGTDIGAIKSAMEKLGEESQALGQAIYEARSRPTRPPVATVPRVAAGDDDVVDAEVVEDDQENK